MNAIKAIRVIGRLGNKNAYEFADLWKGYAAGNARQGKKEVVMGDRMSGTIITAAVAAAAVSTVVATPITQTFAQTPAASGAVPKTSWGEPDLQGIWTDEFDTALQPPAQLANQEFFTEAQRAELDKTRLATLNRFATEREINGAYNRATFRSTKRTGARTSKIVDPPNGRIRLSPQRLRRRRPRIERSVSPCCNPPVPAKISCRPARGAITNRRHRRDEPKRLPITIRCA